ncbi:MAG: hypothetical protein PVI23_07225 [Maricaulaceae bacterium]|jgi:hypothetical protein
MAKNKGKGPKQGDFGFTEEDSASTVQPIVTPAKSYSTPTDPSPNVRAENAQMPAGKDWAESELRGVRTEMKAIKNDLQRQVDQKPGIWKIFFTTAGVAGFAVGIIVASIFAALQLMTDNFSNGLEAGRGVALEALEQYQEQLDQIAESQRQMAETIEEMRDDDTQESEEER